MGYWALVAAALLSNLTPAPLPPRHGGAAGDPSGRAPMVLLPAGVGIKRGVILRGLDRRMQPALRIARDIWRGHGRKLVITSGLDGRHTRNSRHYVGLALDFRSRDLGRAARGQVARELRKALGPRFQVLLEKDHIHVEYHPPPGSRPAKLARSSGAHRKASGRRASVLVENAP